MVKISLLTPILYTFNSIAYPYIKFRINIFNQRYFLNVSTIRSDILNDLCQERRELDSALAWLSTLGGAFSALGDNFEHCVSILNFSHRYLWNLNMSMKILLQAVMAGRISISQFRIALKLGDPQTISRCRLFYAVSLIQRSDLRLARYIIEDEYHKAVTIHLEDKRLKRMCCGIWAKLRYEWRKKYKRKF